MTSLILACIAASLSMAVAAAQSGVPLDGDIISVPLLAANEMSASDASLASSSQTAIAASALIYGYALDSSYAWKQIACPVAPHHLLLTYERVGPEGSASRFTAVVSKEETVRAGAPDRPRIIPVTRFGVVPFVSADKNPHTLEVFNAIVPPAPTGSALASSLQEKDYPLLLRGLCYLAMIGESPAALRTPALNPVTVQAPVPTAAFAPKGITREVFSATSGGNTYQVWTLTFSSTGRLVKVEHVQRRPSASGVDLAAAGAPSTPVAAAASSSAATPAIVPLPAASKVGPPAISVPAAPLPASQAARAEPSMAPVSTPPSVPPNPPAPANPASSGPVAASGAVSTSLAEPVLAHPTPPPPPVPTPTVAAQTPAMAPRLSEPPSRFVRNLPVPPGRFIPDAAMPYPPRTPEK